MKLLTKYILKNHTRLILMTLGIGISLFVLIDIIEKADIFMASTKPFLYTIQYYVLKFPFIVSQILPAVFLLASVIFLAIMIASRESIALQAGGISIYTITRILVCSGIFWAIFQFVLAQIILPVAEQKALQLWRLDIRGWQMYEKTINNLWFTENGYIVEVDSISESGKGTGLTAYKLTPQANDIEQIIKANEVTVQKRVWDLKDVSIYSPQTYSIETKDNFVLPVSQSLKFYFISTTDVRPESLSFFLLSEAIDKLKSSGSNIEGLQTVWHSKITYSVMIIAFAVLSVAIITFKENIYIAVIIAVVCAFLSYVLATLGVSIGQSGKLPPVVAAWFPCLFIFGLSYLRIYYGFSKR